MVENEEPVGVKLTAWAKSKGKNSPKKERSVIRETTTALAYKTYKKLRIFARLFRCEAVTKYKRI